MASSYMFDIPDEELYNGFTAAIHKYFIHYTFHIKSSVRCNFHVKNYFMQNKIILYKWQQISWFWILAAIFCEEKSLNIVN